MVDFERTSEFFEKLMGNILPDEPPEFIQELQNEIDRIRTLSNDDRLILRKKIEGALKREDLQEKVRGALEALRDELGEVGEKIEGVVEDVQEFGEKEWQKIRKPQESTTETLLRVTGLSAVGRGIYSLTQWAKGQKKESFFGKVFHWKPVRAVLSFLEQKFAPKKEEKKEDEDKKEDEPEPPRPEKEDDQDFIDFQGAQPEESVRNRPDAMLFTLDNGEQVPVWFTVERNSSGQEESLLKVGDKAFRLRAVIEKEGGGVDDWNISPMATDIRRGKGNTFELDGEVSTFQGTPMEKNMLLKLALAGFLPVSGTGSIPFSDMRGLVSRLHAGGLDQRGRVKAPLAFTFTPHEKTLNFVEKLRTMFAGIPEFPLTMTGEVTMEAVEESV